MVEINNIQSLNANTVPLKNQVEVGSKSIQSGNLSTVNSMYSTKGLALSMKANYLPSFGASVNVDSVENIIKHFKGFDVDLSSCSQKLAKLFENDSFKALSKADKDVCLSTAAAITFATQKGIKLSELPPECFSGIADYLKDTRSQSRTKGLLNNLNVIKEMDARKTPDLPLDSERMADFRIIKDYAMGYRRTGDLDVVKVLANNGFIGDYNPEVHGESFNVINKFVSRIHQNGIWLPQTEILPASKLKKLPQVISSAEGETKNVVVDLNKDNLEKIGFTKGVSKDSFNVLGHAISGRNFSGSLMDYETSEGTDSLLSTSYFHDGNFSTFMNKKFGFLLDAHSDDISIADNGNMASGFGKDFIDFKNNLIFANRDERTLFSKAFCEKAGIDKSEYSKIYESIANAHTLDDIEDEKIRNLMSETVKEVVSSNTDGINEVVVYAPKIKALFSKENELDKIPFDMRQYAQKKDIPIILLPQD